ncbi:dehydrogenase [Neiella marina]|uniref:Dehydrogenase n=1 Tax=Neiella marina TaxID=508461 RepID=A0A8J2U923_9GAMM|nr:PQQ-dependent sugar dehydrogenase [Neiella marina]GGA86553.1 dehydrogenase [Neiella marina]
MKKIVQLTAFAMALVANAVAAQSWQAEIIAEGLGIPWGLEQVDANTVMVSERQGQIGLLDLSSGKYQPIFQVPDVEQVRQGGSLDIAKSPFKADEYYFTYSKDVGTGIETVLAVATLQQQKLTGWRDIMVTKSGSEKGVHFGSRITFDDKHLYFSIGDRGHKDNGQNTQTHAGTILRLNPDGSVPKDNPFVADDDVLDEIWSYGHRNPQGMFFDEPSQVLWSIEHGPRGGDEINLIKAGHNYGWPKTSHGKEYWGPVDAGEAQELPGIESPRYVYTPSIAPSSLVLYRHSRYPELTGKLLAGALKLAHINVLTLDENNQIVNEERIVEDLMERVRDIEVLSDGTIVFSADTGRIYRLIGLKP